MKHRFALSCSLFVCALTVLMAAPQRDRYVEAEFVTEQTALVPGQTATIALRLKHDEHWHTYWVNPGEAGLATEIKWTLPPGFTAGPIQWPTPEITNTGGVLTYGYGGEVLLLVDLAVPATAKVGSPIEMKGHVSWLMCKESCVPGTALFVLSLPVAPSASPDPRWGAKIATVRAALPRPTDVLTVRGYRTGQTISLVVTPRRPLSSPLQQVAFLAADGTVDPTAFQTPRQAGGALVFDVPQAVSAKNPALLPGLLVARSGWWDRGPKAVAVTIPVVDGPIPAAMGGGAGVAERGLLALLGLAFLGGIILNLMPCVFPVLGIKIMGFVRQAGEHPGKVKAHGFAFTFGVLVSFWLLSTVLLVLRAGGAKLGWGFQLQSPGFVFALAIVMLVFGLSMSGVFEIGGSLIGAGSNLQTKSGYAGSFFSGVLATVVATPCAAPFLAPALGAALALGASESLLVFTAIALGLSVPYLTISLFPALIKVLPRPGAWMETFKQFMAFPLYATAGYLVWVLDGQVNASGLLEVILGLVVVALAAWVFGRWATFAHSPRIRWIGRSVALIFALAGVALGLPQPPARGGIEWQPWSDEAVAKLRAEHRVIYVDFTARWCVTCQANEASVFSSSAVKRRFEQLHVAALKADWTNQDPKITAALQKFARSAVPVNLVYLPERAGPILLPEVLTPGIVLDALKPAGS